MNPPQKALISSISFLLDIEGIEEKNILIK